MGWEPAPSSTVIAPSVCRISRRDAVTSHPPSGGCPGGMLTPPVLHPQENRGGWSSAVGISHATWLGWGLNPGVHPLGVRGSQVPLTEPTGKLPVPDAGSRRH